MRMTGGKVLGGVDEAAARSLSESVEGSVADDGGRSLRDELMPAISMWQPWATLLMRGIKFDETRGWRLPDKLIGKPMLLHAAQKLPGNLPERLDDIVSGELGPHWGLELPRGAFIGCVRFDFIRSTDLRDRTTDEDQIAMGDWSTARWAWRTSERVEYGTPHPAKGRQRIFYAAPYWMTRDEVARPLSGEREPSTPTDRTRVAAINLPNPPPTKDRDAE